MSENQTPPSAPAPPPQPPVTFTFEQQQRIDEIIRKAQGRAAAETRQQLEQERQQREKVETDLHDVQTRAAQSDEALKTANAEFASEKDKRIEAERRVSDFRKQAFVGEQCLTHKFLDAPMVLSLISQNLAWDESVQSFAVVNNDGSPKLSSGGSPMTPDEFFADFAAKKPFMVKSDVRSGSGSQDSSRSSLSTGTGHYKVEQIFGKGSDSRLANELAKRDPREYARLKREAKAKRLI